MQVARHAELRVDRGTAQCLGPRVLNVGVSRGADANGDEFLAVCVQDVGQSGREQNVSGALGHSGELGLHGFQDVVRIVVAHDDGVAGQSVRAGVTARDEAGDVDAGDGGKDGMVSGKGDATFGEGGEIRREVGSDLRWLEAVECDYENAGHWLDVLSVESLSAEPTLTEKATRKRLQLPYRCARYLAKNLATKFGERITKFLTKSLESVGFRIHNIATDEFRVGTPSDNQGRIKPWPTTRA